LFYSSTPKRTLAVTAETSASVQQTTYLQIPRDRHSS
jgi:hypothetical protein